MEGYSIDHVDNFQCLPNNTRTTVNDLYCKQQKLESQYSNYSVDNLQKNTQICNVANDQQYSCQTIYSLEKSKACNSCFK